MQQNRLLLSQTTAWGKGLHCGTAAPPLFEGGTEAGNPALCLMLNCEMFYCSS